MHNSSPTEPAEKMRLLPCSLSDGVPIVRSGYTARGETWWVESNTKFQSLKLGYFDTKEEAIKAWNTRTEATRQQNFGGCVSNDDEKCRSAFEKFWGRRGKGVSKYGIPTGHYAFALSVWKAAWKQAKGHRDGRTS